MKLRIQGSSVRLRLKQSEIASFAEEGRIEDRLEVGPGSALVYAVEAADVNRLEARLEGGTLTVLVPRAEAEDWTSSERVGLETEQPTDSGTLRILLEKDFQCLHRSPPEDESDHYPHPDAKP